MGKSISNKLIKHKLNLLENIGVDINAISTSCGLNNISLNKAEGRTSHHKFTKFLNETSEYNQYIHKGMTSISELYNLFPELFSLCLNETTASRAIESFIKYRFVMGDCDLCKIETTKNQLVIEYIYEEERTTNNSSPIGHFMFFQQILNQYIEGYQTEVSLDDSVPMNKSLINDQLQTNCLYNQGKNQIIITSPYLHEKSDQFNDFLYSLQKDKLNNVKKTLSTHESFSSDIKELIEHFYSNADYTKDSSILEVICDTLGMSRWTLNKKLSLENTSFTEIAKRIKLERAGSLLETTDKSIGEISDLCLFSSQAAFTKFFRQNHNLSPVQYREITRRG